MGISISINQSLCASLCGITVAAQTAACSTASDGKDSLERSPCSGTTAVTCPPESNIQGLSSAENADVEIRALLPSDLGRIHRCLCDGFSTKTTRLDLPQDEMALKLKQNSYRPDISLGAFHEGAMIGFWLSALRTIGNEKTGFGTGTTVLKEWRGNGIAKVMIKVALEIARQKGTSGYSLLVDSSNTPARALYRKLGFEISNPLVSYSTDKLHTPFNSLGFKTKGVDIERALETGAAISHDEFSWHNMDEGIRATSNSHIAVLALDEDGRESGYGIFQPQTGRISRLSVRSMDSEREDAAIRGILSFFDKHALENKSPEIFQVHEKSSRIFTHLGTLGFRPKTVQHEMSKKL